MHKRSIFILAFVAGLTSYAFSQKAKTHVLTTDEAKMVKKDAATMFASQDYRGSLQSYKELIKTDPNNIDYNYRLGFSYLQTQSRKSEALKYMKKAVDAQPNKKEWLFSLGQAYMHNNQFDEAIKAFQDFINSKPKLAKDAMPIERWIEMCNNGKQLVSQPVDVTYTNLGKNINTIFDEYNPMISADGRSLIFTSRRQGNIGGFIEDLGIYTSDLYWTMWKDTVWTKAKGLGGMVNSEWDEELVGISPLGDQIMIYFDNTESYADVGYATVKGKMWQKPELFNTQINSKQYEGGATVSSDGNTIFFSSNRKEGNGGNDIWMIKKETNGEWSSPVNLGNSVNTKYDDDFPMLSIDGKHLYFCSKGWNSMGGYDIFRSDLDESTQSWSKPVNIGYPINDADDNTMISFTGDGKHAYMACSKPEDVMGERDIYKLTFNNEAHHKFTRILTGKITGTGGKIEVTKVTLTSSGTGKKSEFRPSGFTNDYIFSVDPGSYTITVEGYNFPPFNDNLTVEDDKEVSRIQKDIQVTAGK